LYTEGFVLDYNYATHDFERLKKITPLVSKPQVKELDNVRMVKNYGRTLLRDIDDQFIQTWHIVNRDDKDDRRTYKCVTFDQEGKMVNSFIYESSLSRDWKFLNLKVFDEKGVHCGYLNVFGFDDKAPKELRGENEDLYELVYTSLKGEIISRFEFVNPAKKRNRIFDPFTAIFKNGKFHLFNSRKETAFKRTEEVLIIDPLGTVSNGNFMSDKQTKLMQDVVYYQSNSRPDWGFGLDSAVWTVKIVAETKDTRPPYGYFEQRYRQLVFTKHSANGITDIFRTLLPDSIRRPLIYLIDMQPHQVTYLIKSGGVYYKCTINGATGKRAVTDATPNLEVAPGEPVKVLQLNDVQPIRIPETNVSYVMLLVGPSLNHLSEVVMMKY
jgi:hypothetical protein